MVMTSKMLKHPFHLVKESIWPIFMTISALMMTSGMIKIFYKQEKMLFLLGLILTISVMYHWWKDITTESTFMGSHSKIIQSGLRMGMTLFIMSEIFFFLSFFWAFFHLSISPSINIGMMWPPTGISIINPIEIPLLNSVILLSSGISVTWAHHSLMENNIKEFKLSMAKTVMLAIWFLMSQYMEYCESSFSISDSSFGSIIFIGTGFHGLHVFVGLLILTISMFRFYNSMFSMSRHLGLEMAIWYWHFVDVVWLILFIFFYLWTAM